MKRNFGVWIALAVVCAGCGEELDETYGVRSGFPGGKGVNGTSVLADHVDQAGHTVNTSSYLSPRVSQRADAIVWFGAWRTEISPEAATWLERWLATKPG